MSFRPLYDLPGIEIVERVTNNEIYVTLFVDDWVSFERELDKAKKGGVSDFVRRKDGNRSVWVRICNRGRDGIKSKKL